MHLLCLQACSSPKSYQQLEQDRLVGCSDSDSAVHCIWWGSGGPAALFQHRYGRHRGPGGHHEHVWPAVSVCNQAAEVAKLGEESVLDVAGASCGLHGQVGHWCVQLYPAAL